METRRELSLKQKILIYLYKSVQYIWYKLLYWNNRFIKITNSTYFHLVILATLLLVANKLLLFFDVTISGEAINSIALTISGIIGASIAIVFSFSTFILQSTADLFSTQYLNQYIEDTREKVFFWLLVLFTAITLLTPHFVKIYQIEVLVGILLLSFYLIFVLYKALRQRINPETTLRKIKTNAVKELEKISRSFKRHSYIQNKIFQYKKNEANLSLDILYRSRQDWNANTLESIKHLYEIGLRLLAKNEINSFNYSVKCIHNIYLKHLSLRNESLIRTPASLFGGYVVDDQGFTNRVLEYLQSIGERIVQEKRKENIYYLLEIYQNLIKNALHIKYADVTLSSHKGNPILSIVLSYYSGFVERLIESQENDWIWESVKSVSTVSSEVLEVTDDYFEYDQISKLLGKVTLACVVTRKEAFVTELLKAYFNQIRISWNRYERNEILWKHILEELKKAVLLCSVIEDDKSLSMAGSFIGFHEWQANVINWIFGIKEKEDRKENLEKFIFFMERWSDFLLDLARETGLENKRLGLPIIQSIDNNLRIIHGVKNKFRQQDLKETYRRQFNTLSWYFEHTESVDKSLLFNLEQVLEILLREINNGFQLNIDEIEGQIELYIRLIEQHFEKTKLGYGYDHPRIVVKLVHLGLILNKHKQDGHENLVIAKINELNNKYLKLNSEFFKLKKKKENLVGPNEFQLCKEMHDLKEDLFSYNNRHLMGAKQVLSNSVSEKEWDDFVGKIKYCEGIEYITRSIF